LQLPSLSVRIFTQIWFRQDLALVERSSSGKVAHRKFFYGYIVVAAGFAIWFFGFGANNFGVFFKPLVDEFGWSRADTALASSLNMIASAAITVGIGWLTDKLGPRLVVSVFGPFLGISFLIMSHITSLWQFYLNYALISAIGFSVLLIPIMATISRWFVKKRGLMMGIVQSGQIGGSLFAPLNAWMIITYGWRTAYTILGIIVFLGLLISGLFLLRDPSNIGQMPDGNKELGATAKPNKKTSVPGFSLKQAIGTSQFWVIAFLFFTFGFCRDAFLVHIPPHVQDLGFSLIDAANILSCLTAFSMVGRIGMGYLSDVIGNKKSLTISEITTTVALIIGFFSHDLWGLYIFAAAFGFGWGAQAVNRFSVSAEAFGLASAGFLMGVLRVAESVAGAFGTFFAGFTFDMTGNYQPVFVAGIIVSLFSIIISPVLQQIENRKKMRKPGIMAAK
jgi:MFS family permease